MIRAKYIMRERVAVKPDTTARDAASKIMSCGHAGVPVVNGAREVVGVLTEFNILGALRDGKDLDTVTTESIMSKQPMVADIDASADELVDMMLKNNFTIIPIVKNEKFVGVVSRYEIIDAYMSPEFEIFFDR